MRTLAEERNITTKLLIDDLGMWDEFDIKKNQDPQVDEYYKTIMELINQQIQNGVKWLDSDDARDYFFGEAEYQQEVFRALEDEWDNILNGSYGNVEELLEEVYHRGKQKGYSDIRSRIRYTDTDKLALTFARNYNFGLITKLNDDVTNQIKNKIIEGVIAGEHPSKLAPKILNIAEKPLEESIFTPKQRATMIARTEVSRVQNTGILQSYINEGYTEVKILTAEDDNVCYTCLRYAFEFNDEDHVTFENRGKERIHNIRKLIGGGSFPPFHPNCRCTYLSVWKSRGKHNSEDDLVMCLVPQSKTSEKPKLINSCDEFNKLKNDPNVKWEIGTIELSNIGLKDEKMIKYYFKDSNITICKTIEEDVLTSVKDLLNFYKNELPKGLTSNCETIIISNQIVPYKNNPKKYVGGFVLGESNEIVTILNHPEGCKEDFEDVLIHELAHAIDGKNYRYSNKEAYEPIYNDDLDDLKRRGIYHGSAIYVSPYSEEFTTNALGGGKGADRPYSEDFAEAVIKYIRDPESLFWLFPNKAEYINNILHKYTQEEISGWFK